MENCDSCTYFNKYETKMFRLNDEDVGWGECSYFGQEFYYKGCCRNYQSRDFHNMMANLINAKRMKIKKIKK